MKDRDARETEKKSNGNVQRFENGMECKELICLSGRAQS